MSDPADNVYEADFGQVPLFEGWEPVGTRFSLRSVNRLSTDLSLKKNQHVTGTFSGRVKSFQSWEDSDGNDLVVWVIEVLDADIS